MVILPAIDLLDGNCVRLYKGEYNSSEKVAENALDTALMFKNSGAKWLHTVDLNGAKGHKSVNFDIIKELATSSGLNIETGGGIRSLKIAEKYLNAGVKRIILGSAAVKNPELVSSAIKEFSAESVAIGIDAVNGYVKTEGWLEKSDIFYVDLAKKMQDLGVKYIIFTDISKDGTLEGANIKMLKILAQSIDINIIASGGIRDLNDIKKIKELNLYGAICGKSLYKGTLELDKAIKIANV